MAPTLVNSYIAKTSSPTTGAITTASFTPTNGEILVIKAETWDATITMSTPTGGSQTYTSRVAYGPAGFRPWVGIWTAVVSGSPGAMTVSSTPSASAQCSLLVERWSGAQLAATPVTATANASSGAANGSLTTTAANSVISWVASDAQSLDPATRAYLNSASDEGVRDGHVGANGVGYHAQQAVPSAGATSFGLSAPTGMQYAIAGIEVKAASGTIFTQSVAGGVTPAGALLRQTGKSPAGAITPAGAVTRMITKTLAGAITPAGVLRRTVAKSLTGALAAAGGLAKSIRKSFSGSIASSGSLGSSGGAAPVKATSISSVTATHTSTDAAAATTTSTDAVTARRTLSGGVT